jgi:hypothetical protein
MAGFKLLILFNLFDIHRSSFFIWLAQSGDPWARKQANGGLTCFLDVI